MAQNAHEYRQVDLATQADDDLRKHTVVIGKTADAGKGLVQACPQMGLNDADVAAPSSALAAVDAETVKAVFDNANTRVFLKVG